jgi:carbon-monoxide dehydrogenase medium subunit
MTPFEFLLPYSLDEALGLLDPEDPDVRPVGGGTAVMLMMKAGVLRPRRLVSLRQIGAAHSAVEVNAAGELVIGGMATLASLERSAQVREGWPMLARTLRTLANVRVRAVATIGGNLSHADPHMDLPPVLAALGARLTVASPRGRRDIGADDFCTGYYETALARDELVVQVTVPSQRGPGAYLKLTTRAAHDWPALGLAVLLDLEGDRVRRASIVVGAATDRPTRLRAAQSALERGGLGDHSLAQAGEAAATEIDIVGDAHGSAAYKRHLLQVSLGRAVRAAVAGTRGTHE